MGERSQFFAVWIALLAMPCFGSVVRARQTLPDQEANQILEATGVEGGLIVHVGCGEGRLTATLRAHDGYLVHGLDPDAGNVQKARRHIQSLGLYGGVSVDTLEEPGLPYIDNLANLVVAENLRNIPESEVMRVLCPKGVAYIKKSGTWTKTVKPFSKNIDEWTHYLHGPDNNAVARDTVVGPPRHMQWLGGPRWARNHHTLCSISSVVTARGRIFYIVDEASAANMNLPGKWAIVARDAFSGVRLWRKRLSCTRNCLCSYRLRTCNLPKTAETDFANPSRLLFA